jgi:hypothetical protein
MSRAHPLTAISKTPATIRRMIRDRPATRLARVQFQLGKRASHPATSNTNNLRMVSLLAETKLSSSRPRKLHDFTQ